MRNILAFTEAYIAHCQIENLRDYIGRGRCHAHLATDALNVVWVDTYRARLLDDIDAEHTLCDLGCEFRLRGSEPPMHLVATEAELFRERYTQLMRNMRLTPAELEKAEAELERFRHLLQAPKN